MIALTKYPRRCLISCRVFEREISEILRKVPGDVTVTYLPMGLHGDTADNARRAIQEAIDKINPDRFDAVLVGFGVCNQGIRGLVAGTVPLVLPRVHDCIATLFGDRTRYEQFFSDHPDSYFLTSGWVDAQLAEGDRVAPRPIESQLGLDSTFDELRKKYGEDNARYIHEELNKYRQRYHRHVYLTSGCRHEETIIDQARKDAAAEELPLEIVRGDTSILQRLLVGPWDEETFLVVPPGEQVTVVYGERLIDCQLRPADHQQAE